VNSYKRFLKGTFAPTKIAWSIDNRTAGYRLCGDGTKAVRIECRIGGSDINPYLACAAQLAAGLSGIEEGLTLDEPVTGDVYGMEDVPSIPHTCAPQPRLCATLPCSERRWATGSLIIIRGLRKSSRKRSTQW
jgi:glutamine synthetase